MTIIDGWIDWAERRDGHPLKQYSKKNSAEWITCHSIVGDLPNHAIPSRFLDDSRKPDGSFTDSAAASVMFILYKDGHLIQMYPVTSSTWTSGGSEANTRSWAVEAEGGYGSNQYEKLTLPAQVSFVRLVREWELYTGRKALPNETLLQHKQVAVKFGYSATACASDRYSDAWEACLSNEDDMYKEQYDELNEAIKMRLALIALASDLDRYEDMKKAYMLLKQATIL